MVVLEAMAAAKPIVATDVGGVSEAVIDGLNGFLVRPRDPDSMAKAILRLLRNPNEAKSMGEQGRRMISSALHSHVMSVFSQQPLPVILFLLLPLITL